MKLTRTHSETDTHTACTRIRKSSAAYWDDCSLSGDWGMFTILVANGYFLCVCFHNITVLVMISLFFHLLEIRVKLPYVPISPFLSAIISFHGAMIFPIAGRDRAIRLISVSIIHLWVSCFKRCCFFCNKIIVWMNSSLLLLCVQAKVYLKVVWIMPVCNNLIDIARFFINKTLICTDKWTFNVIFVCCSRLTQAISTRPKSDGYFLPSKYVVLFFLCMYTYFPPLFSSIVHLVQSVFLLLF